MPEPRWSTEQVHALAPDASSLSAARKLATGSGWSQEGCGGETLSVWGLCKGSGSTPYQAVVDLGEPAYKCSCPSRKFPCKHALGLLLRWAAGQVPQADPPEFVRQWHAGRAERAQKRVERAEKAAEPRTPEQELAAQRRAAKRADRMAEGVSEVRRWLDDQVRHGIAGLDRAGYRHFDQVAARLVDAQAPALASAVRRLGSLPASGAGWEERLLSELGLLRLLTEAYGRLDELPQPLAQTVAARIGHPVTTEQVLATPPVRDVWQVLGSRDEIEERLTARRVWLLGRETGRIALVLSFAAPGQALSVDLVVGAEFDGELCFYPGSGQLRALVAQRHRDVRQIIEPGPVTTVDEALAAIAAGLAADPWLTRTLVLLRGALIPGSPWHIADASGAALPLAPSAPAPWPMLATTQGEPALFAAEWSPDGLTPLAVWTRSDETVLA
jgi:SWIM zinc finger